MTENDAATVLITGGSQGVGASLARYFAGRGRRVIVASRNEEGLRKTCESIEKDGGDCVPYGLDLADVESIRRFVGALEGDARTIDILINNAADVTSKPLQDTSLEEIDRLVRVNVTGALQLVRLTIPLMEASKRPSIVNISSLAGYKPNPAQTVYSITKAAVNGMSMALRSELAPRGFHVLNVALSTVHLVDGARGAVTAAVLGQKLERAIERRQDELYFSWTTQWLMRLYTLFPPLMKLR